jgi:two-component sensor histidine kinase
MPSAQHIQLLHDGEQTLMQMALNYADTYHRIANSLQFLAATLRMQARGVQDQNARFALLDAERRLVAVGLIHRLLQNQNADNLSFDKLLQELAAALRSAWLEPSSGLSVRVFCLPISLPKAKAVPLAMIVSELVCNAFKYAYPSAPEGEVRVIVEIEGCGALAVSVEDDGCGFGNGPSPAGLGTGEKIINGLASQISATMKRCAAKAGSRTLVRMDLCQASVNG